MIRPTEAMSEEVHRILKSPGNKRSMISVEVDVAISHGAPMDEILRHANDLAIQYLVFAVNHPEDLQARDEALEYYRVYMDTKVKYIEQN